MVSLQVPDGLYDGLEILPRRCRQIGPAKKEKFKQFYREKRLSILYVKEAYLLSELKGDSMSTKVTSSPACWRRIGEEDPSPWAKWDRWARWGGNWKERTGKEDKGGSEEPAGDEGADPPAIERLRAGDGTREASSTTTLGSPKAPSSRLPVWLWNKDKLRQVNCK